MERRWEDLLALWKDWIDRSRMHIRRMEPKFLYAVDEKDSDSSGEVHEADADLQAWCILDERDHEQWQEVISRKA